MTETENIIQKEHPDLYKRTLKSGFWVLALQVSTQLLGITKSIIVAHCFQLENLGLLAVAMMLIRALNALSESGFNAALIQKKENIADYLDTAWVMGIIRGLILFTVLYFAAPLASFKVAPEDVSLTINVIRVMGLSFLISAFRNIGVVYFSKDLNLRKTFWIGIASTLTDVVIAIPLVIIFKNVWAYVFARLASVMVGLILSYVLCSYRPKFHFISEKAKELWQFGKWLFGSKILGYILTEGDDFFIWIFLGAPELALYTYAYKYSNMPASYITETISKVSFPAYSKIQHDIPRLREAYLKVLKITAFLAIPTAFMIFSIGPDFVRLILPERMWPLIPVLQILAFKGLYASIGATRGPVFNALKKPQATLKFKWMRLVILGSTIYPLAKLWGISGVAFATVLISVLTNPLGLILSAKMLKCPVLEILKQSFYPFIASIIATLALFLLKKGYHFEATIISFVSLLIFVILLYLIALWTIDSLFGQQYRNLAKEQLTLIIQKKDFK